MLPIHRDRRVRAIEITGILRPGPRCGAVWFLPLGELDDLLAIELRLQAGQVLRRLGVDLRLHVDIERHDPELGHLVEALDRIVRIFARPSLPGSRWS